MFLVKLINSIARFLALMGTFGIVAMMLHITADVVLRSLFSFAVPVTLEMVTRYYMVLLALLPLAWVEWQRNMITVEAFSGVYGVTGVRVIDALVSVLCAVVYALLAMGTWDKAMDQYHSGAYIMALDTAIAVWPSYFVLPVAFALAGMVCLVRAPLPFIASTKESAAAGRG